VTAASGGPVLRGVLLTLTATVTYSTVGVSSRLAADAGLGIFPFLAWRALGATIALVLGVTLATRAGLLRLPPAGAIPRAEQGRLVGAALANIVITGAMMLAFARIPVALGLILFYVHPAIVAVVSARRHGEPLTGRRIGALALAFAGLLLVLVVPALGGGGIAVDPIGVALALGAALLQAVYMLIAARGYPTIPSIVAVLTIMALSIPGNLLIAAGTGALDELALPLGDPLFLALALGAGLVGAAIPATALQAGLRRLGATGATVLMMLEPVSAALLAFLLLGEQLAQVQVLGGAMVVLGGMLLQLPERPVRARSAA